jgi:glycosyltransferase involved in cell wall biosynthesis
MTPETPKTQPSGVQIFNNWPHAAVMHAWRKCLFGVAPSIGPELSAAVIMEAMAMGKPIIVTNMGGNPDIVADVHEDVLRDREYADRLQFDYATVPR